MGGPYRLGTATRQDILAGQWAIVQQRIESNRRKAARQRDYRVAEEQKPFAAITDTTIEETTP